MLVGGCLHRTDAALKCDESQPACSNCIKSGRVCPGPPREADLIFRAVNPDRQKSRKGRKSKPSRKQVDEDTVVSQRKTSNFGTRLVANATFNPAVASVATTFFFNALRTPAGLNDATHEFMELAVPMYLAAQDGSPLQLAVEALSLASLSKKFGMQNLQQNASKKYSQALKSLGKTLSDPETAKSNATIETILLLSSYEAGSCEANACEAWGKHVEGAASIVMARGVDQINDTESLVLFRAVRAQTLSSVIQRGKPMPEFPHPQGWNMDLNAQETARLDQSVKLARLLSRAKPTLALERTPTNMIKVEALLEEAYELMQDLAERQICALTTWLARTVATTSGEQHDMRAVEEMEVWPLPYFHIYKDIDSVCTKNSERLVHMPCSTLVIDALKWLCPEEYAYKHDHRYLIAKARLQVLVDDICASVPYCWYGEDAARPDTERRPRQWSGKSGTV